MKPAAITKTWIAAGDNNVDGTTTIGIAQVFINQNKNVDRRT